MKFGDLVKIKDESRSPTDCRLSGVIIDDTIFSHTQAVPAPQPVVRVLWQNEIIGLIPVWRLEVINESG